MATIKLTATSYQGRLRVDVELPADVPDGEHNITININDAEPTMQSIRERLRDKLPIMHFDADKNRRPFSEQERNALIEQISQAGPISDLIIQEREDRI